MSLILDALRKSERTRQQSLTGQLGAAETPPRPGRMAVPWVTLLVILLVINAVVLAVFFWRSDEHAAAQAVPATPPMAYHPEVRPLSEEAGPPPGTAAPAPPRAVAVQAAPAAPAAAPAPSPQTAGPVMAQNADVGVPSLDTLPVEVRQTLPTLHLDVLGYAMKPEDRFVVINFQRYRVGDATAEGVRVADIVPGGAILEYHGTRFLLPP
ncbi:MAG TPA: general secretion pathway protein GspB [Gammaproteobacteria bacterium]|nr:general secretion pathway protein GspB [Gammaproteobacteria bacterium]